MSTNNNTTLQAMDLSNAFVTAISKMNRDTAHELVTTAMLASKSISEIAGEDIADTRQDGAEMVAEAISFNEDSKRKIAMKCYRLKELLTIDGFVKYNDTLYKTVNTLAEAIGLTPSTFKRYANCGNTPIAKDSRFDNKPLDFFDKVYRLFNPEKDDKRVLTYEYKDITPDLTVKDIENMLNKARGKVIDTTAKPKTDNTDNTDNADNTENNTVNVETKSIETVKTADGEIKVDSKNNAIHLKNVTPKQLVEWCNKAIKDNNLIKHINGTLTFTKI